VSPPSPWSFESASERLCFPRTDIGGSELDCLVASMACSAGCVKMTAPSRRSGRRLTVWRNGGATGAIEGAANFWRKNRNKSVRWLEIFSKVIIGDSWNANDSISKNLCPKGTNLVTPLKYAVSPVYPSFTTKLQYIDLPS
jgi:hypothetical protein